MNLIYLYLELLKGVVELAFANKEVRKICEDEQQAITAFGDAIAKKLKDRLADIWAAVNVYDIVVGNPLEIESKTDHTSNYKVDIGSSHRLIFCPNHVDEKLDWNRVSRIKIIEIHEI